MKIFKACGGAYFVSDWRNYLHPMNKVMTHPYYFRFRSDAEDALSTYNKIQKEGKMFTKDDLKSGMKVIYKNGKLRLVVDVDGKLVLFDRSFVLCSRASHYNDDLSYGGSVDFSIEKVLNRHGATIWRRKEESETDKKIKELEMKLNELKEARKNE